MIFRYSLCLFVAVSFLAFFSPAAETEETKDSASKSAPAKEQRKETFTRKEHYEALSEYLKRARANDQKRQEKELPQTLVVLKPGESRTVTTVLNGPIGGRQQLQYFSESYAYPDEKTTKPNAGDFGEFVEFHRNGFKIEEAKSDSGDVSQQLKKAGRFRYAALTHNFTADKDAAPGTHTVYAHWGAGTGRQTRRRIAFCVVIVPGS